MLLGATLSNADKSAEIKNPALIIPLTVFLIGLFIAIIQIPNYIAVYVIYKFAPDTNKTTKILYAGLTYIGLIYLLSAGIFALNITFPNQVDMDTLIRLNAFFNVMSFAATVIPIILFSAGQHNRYNKTIEI